MKTIPEEQKQPIQKENFYIENAYQTLLAELGANVTNQMRQSAKEGIQINKKRGIGLCCCGVEVEMGPREVDMKVDLVCFSKIAYQGHSQPVNQVHLSTLQHLYFVLTNKTDFDWTCIGFQNENDPTSDFRGVGMFGVLQMTYLVQYYKDVAVEIFKTAQKDDVLKSFPFFCASLAITKIVLDRIRDGKLDKLYTEDEDIYSLANQMHIKLFQKLSDTWIQKNCTIRDFQPVMQEVAKFSKKMK